MLTEFGYFNDDLQVFYNNGFALCRVKITLEQEMCASCPPVAPQQDPSGNLSGTSTSSGAFPPDDVSNNNDDNVLQCLIPKDRVEISTQTCGSGGPLLAPSARAAFHSD